MPIFRCLLALAQGKRSEAAAFLDGASDDAIRNFDVIALWNLLRAAELPAGELRLLGTIDRFFSDSLTHELHAVNILQTCGRHDDAVARLERATFLSGIADRLDAVTAIAGLIGRLDIAHAVGTRPDVVAALSEDRRREWLLRLARDYQQAGQRGQSFALLHDLAADKTSPTSVLQEIARRIEAAGNAGYALDIRKRLLDEYPDDELLKVEVIESLTHLDPAQALERALAMAGSASTNAVARQRLALLLSHSNRHKDAVRIARQALSQGGDPVECRYPLIRSLVALKTFKEAAVELALLLPVTVPPLQCREMSDTALIAGRLDLAVALGEKHLARQPTDTGAILHVCNVLAQAKQFRRARTLLLTLLADVSAGRSMSEQDAVRLVQLLGSIGDIDAEERAVQEGLRRFPVNADLLGRNASSAMFAGAKAAQAGRAWTDEPLARKPAPLAGLLRRLFGRTEASV